MTDDTRKGTDRLGWPTIIHVAVTDVGWLVILLPLSVVFRALLLVATGYYRLRRRSRFLGGAYAFGVIGAIAWLVARILRLWRD